MKKIHRTMSIDDYLSRIDRESLTSWKQFDTHRCTNSFKSDQQSLLIKLKNENFQRTLKLKSLKEITSSYLCGNLDFEPNNETYKGDEKNSLIEAIQGYENKAQIETGYSEQLQRMRLNVKDNIVPYI